MAPTEEVVQVFLSPAPEVTEDLGRRLGHALVPGSLVALSGELGSGKTTLVRGLARGLGVVEPVQSPTFVRMRELPGRATLFHVDAWREGAEEFLRDGAEFLAGEGVAAVEWAERVERWLPRPRIEIRLVHRSHERREIRMRVIRAAERGPQARALESALCSALEQAALAPGLEGIVNPEATPDVRGSGR